MMHSKEYVIIEDCGYTTYEVMEYTGSIPYRIYVNIKNWRC